MKKYYLFIFFAMMVFSFRVSAEDENNPGKDTLEVIKLNKQAFQMRLTDPGQTVSTADRALLMAGRINYKRGIGESYRIRGIGNYYLTQPVKAIHDYLLALTSFRQIKDLKSEGKVDNNIGNLYRDNDYNKALDYFNSALAIAIKLSDKQLIASSNLNIGTVYYSKNSFNQALNYYEKSDLMFIALKDSINQVQCIQNIGVVYYHLKQYDKAEELLLRASNAAKKLDLNESIARIDLVLTDLYIVQNKFDDAEKTIAEGLTLSDIVKSKKTAFDLKYMSYLLELKRKKYQPALAILTDLYKQDSTVAKQNTAAEITGVSERVKQEANLKENELLKQREAYDRVRFWSVLIMAALLLILVAVLVNNVKRKARTNTQLTSLNEEVSRQKDNLDRINHHLEEIIDERTKDLQVKNKKLSEYSSYLSHQIRGPIATLKGLMNLEKEGLVDQPECIRMMNKCVGEIDDKIIEMSDMLHDPGRAGF